MPLGSARGSPSLTIAIAGAAHDPDLAAHVDQMKAAPHQFAEGCDIVRMNGRPGILAPRPGSVPDCRNRNAASGSPSAGRWRASPPSILIAQLAAWRHGTPPVSISVAAGSRRRAARGSPQTRPRLCLSPPSRLGPLRTQKRRKSRPALRPRNLYLARGAERNRLERSSLPSGIAPTRGSRPSGPVAQPLQPAEHQGNRTWICDGNETLTNRPPDIGEDHLNQLFRRQRDHRRPSAIALSRTSFEIDQTRARRLR